MVGVGAYAQGGRGSEAMIDRNATTKEIRYLAGVCLYRREITYNDNAMINALNVLSGVAEAAAGKGLSGVAGRAGGYHGGV